MKLPVPDYLFGIDLFFDNAMQDGMVVMMGNRIIIGTRPLTYIESTVRQINLDVFGEEFLKRIGMYESITSEEIKEAFRKRGFNG